MRGDLHIQFAHAVTAALYGGIYAEHECFVARVAHLHDQLMQIPTVATIGYLKPQGATRGFGQYQGRHLV